MLVGEIARQTMDQKTVDAINDVLATWKTDFPDYSDFTKATTWPDFIKCASAAPYCTGNLVAIESMNNWHFSDIVYNPDGVPVPESTVHAWDQQPSAVWLLGEAVDTFSASKTTWGWSFMLRFFLHILGDIHQPLHCAEGFFNDTQFGELLNGDMGGNLIKVDSKYPGVTNLHALWDAAGGIYRENAPYDAAATARLEKNASELIASIPKSSLPDYDSVEFAACFADGGHGCGKVFERWANESLALAVANAYNGASADFSPSDEYYARAQNVSKHRIALGGYRLADVMSAVAVNLPKLRQGSATVDASAGDADGAASKVDRRRSAAAAGGGHVVAMAAHEDRGSNNVVDQTTTVMLLSISAGVLAVVVVVLGALLYRTKK